MLGSLDTISLVVLSFTWGAQVFLRPLWICWLRGIWLVGVGAIAATTTYWAILQYRLWQGDSMGRFLLPPHQPITYYLTYVRDRIFLSWLIASAAAILLHLLVKRLNQRFGERFMEREEVDLLALGVFLTGYPFNLLYLVLLLGITIVWSLYCMLTGRGRAPLYYLWLPAACAAILISSLIVPPDFWVFFRF